MWKVKTYQCVTDFMISSQTLFFLRNHHGFTSNTHQNFIFSVVKIEHINLLLTTTGGQKSCLIHQVSKVGTCKTRCTFSNHFTIHIMSKKSLLGVHFRKLQTCTNIWSPHDNTTVKTART